MSLRKSFSLCDQQAPSVVLLEILRKINFQMFLRKTERKA